MLQGIHAEGSAGKASSLYCIWVRFREDPKFPLTAVWMDEEMRGFEAEMAAETGAGETRELFDFQE